jgi:hypothetical protein
VVYLSVLELVDGTKVALTNFHIATSVDDQMNEKRIVDSMKNFLHLVRVDYSK